MKFYKLMLAGAAALALALAAGPASAQKKYDEGASDTEIRIGNTNPYSGPASAYGQIGKAIEAYFKMVNDKGGINGRKVNFITYDDGYAPPKTVEMVRKLVEEDKVLFVYQTLGTPSNTAIHKYLNGKKVPQLFVATGASVWGKPKEFPWTMGWQPDYQTEGTIYAKHILANVKDAKIAVLMQNDDYGRDYFNGFKAGLGKDADKIVQVATYEVADPTVDSQIIALKNSGANAFFNITTPKFAAQAIKKAAEIGWKPAHYLNNVSSSVGAVMKPAGFDAGQGILTASYIKDPTDAQWDKDADMVAWNAFMDKFYPGGDKKSTFPAYAYAVSSTVAEVLKRAGDNLTRENVMKQAASLKGVEIPLLLPGIKINTSATDFYPIQSVRLARFKGETFELFGDILSGESGIAVTSGCRSHGRQPGLYKSPIGHNLPGGLFVSTPSMTAAPPPSLSAALVSGARTLPPSAFAERIARAASGFAALGVRQGDCVALLLRNDFAFLEASLAAVRLGAYAVPINWHFKADEVAYVLADCAAKVLVAHADLLAPVAGASPPASR